MNQECSNNENLKNCHHVKSCVKKVPIFSGLNSEELTRIASIATTKELAKGEMLFLAGNKLDKLYVIHQGKIKISRLSEDGKEQVIRVLEQGEFIGELSLFTNSTMNSNAEAMEQTTVCLLEGQKIYEIIKNSDIAFKILKELSLRLEQAEDLIGRLGLYDAEKRIIETLLSLADENGTIYLNMSKRDLASSIGITQETLSRKLSYFQEQNWIKIYGHKIIQIIDKKGFNEQKVH